MNKQFFLYPTTLSGTTDWILLQVVWIQIIASGPERGELPNVNMTYCLNNSVCYKYYAVEYEFTGQ